VADQRITSSFAPRFLMGMSAIAVVPAVFTAVPAFAGTGTVIERFVRHGRGRIFVAALLVALAFAYTPPAQAGGVVSTCDEPSLRAALAGGGTVTFTCSGTITLTTANGGRIDILSDTTIDGAGQNVTISGGGAVQIFGVASGVKFNVNKLTIANGASTYSGGGIVNSGTLTVTNSTFSGNTASVIGGGIQNAGTLTVTNSTFSGNSSDVFGGAISSQGTLITTVTNSTFSGNTAGANGGGINNGAPLTVTNSTFSGNRAGTGALDGDGGGIMNSGTLTVTNSTFSGNRAAVAGGGGGISNFGTLTVTNSTFSGNSGAFGGAIGGPATLKNTLLANSPIGGNCAAGSNGSSNTSLGHNLSDDQTCGSGFTQTGDMNNTPAGLDPAGLKNNGGPTQTIALLPISPAVDAIPVSPINYCTATDGTTPIATDQRGVTRPQGPACDIGAFELVQADAPITATGATFGATEGVTFTGTVATFTDPDPASTAAEYSATIDWGDSTPTTPGTISGTPGGPFTVSGTHMYAEQGTYAVTVVITDNHPSNTATAHSTARVSDARLSSTCATMPVSAQIYTGPTAIFADQSSTGTLSDFSATISWGDSSSSAGTISGGPGNAPYTVSGTHTYASTGTFLITTTIADVGGSTTTTPACSVTIFAFATGRGAAFVIGDLEAGLGNHVTWWSSQWAKINLMSGGPPPSSMKGFAGFEDNFLGLPPPNCGGSWSTDTGNSTPPPPSVPKFMGVIVSSLVTQSGSVISGNIKQVLVVRTDPGYAPNPGSPGTGTEVAIVCTTP
jgi:predicted outer membrane repeat protein